MEMMLLEEVKKSFKNITIKVLSPEEAFRKYMDIGNELYKDKILENKLPSKEETEQAKKSGELDLITKYYREISKIWWKWQIDKITFIKNCKEK